MCFHDSHGVIVGVSCIDMALSIKTFPPDVIGTQACRLFCRSVCELPWNSPRESRLFLNPRFCSRQLGSATDKFATVHVTVVSADNGECGSAPARSRQFNEICHCLFARCLFICPFKQSTVVWRRGGGRAINMRLYEGIN